MIRFLFKQPQPRRFKYQPRHYDETKEYLESRKAAIRRQLDTGKTTYSPEQLRGQLNHRWRAQQNKKINTASNKRVLIIVAVLAAIAYYLLFS